MQNSGQRGFPNVCNKNKNFYKATVAGTTPKFDVLMTNPPYSEDHMEKILRFCVSCSKPWFLLVPTYVYANECYDKVMGEADTEPFFVAPKYRYA